MRMQPPPHWGWVPPTRTGDCSSPAWYAPFNAAAAAAAALLHTARPTPPRPLGCPAARARRDASAAAALVPPAPGRRDRPQAPAPMLPRTAPANRARAPPSRRTASCPARLRPAAAAGPAVGRPEGKLLLLPTSVRLRNAVKAAGQSPAPHARHAPATATAAGRGAPARGRRGGRNRSPSPRAHGGAGRGGAPRAKPVRSPRVETRMNRPPASRDCISTSSNPLSAPSHPPRVPLAARPTTSPAGGRASSTSAAAAPGAMQLSARIQQRPAAGEAGRGARGERRIGPPAARIQPHCCSPATQAAAAMPPSA
jgi:hypothetical protein